MPDINQTARQFHRALLVADADTLMAIVAAFLVAFDHASSYFDDIVSRLHLDQRELENVDDAKRYLATRAAETTNIVGSILSGFANQAGGVITTAQRERVNRAVGETASYVQMANDAGVYGSFTRPPVEALQQFVGTLADGSPLRDLLDDMADEGGRVVADALVTGIASGSSPHETARAMRDAMQIPKVRAMRIARTETMRSYRGATGENYAANADVITGWRWLAELSANTCPVCWAMHGTIHPLSEPFGTHINCRCCQVPVIAGMDEPMESGESIFGKLPETEQARIVDSPEKLDMIRAGKIRLRDLVNETYDPQWGLTRTERSLRSIKDGDRYKPARIPKAARIPVA